LLSTQSGCGGQSAPAGPRPDDSTDAGSDVVTDAGPEDSTDAGPHVSIDAGSVDPGPYCAAASAFLHACIPDASASCTSQFAATCPAVASNLSAAARDAVVGCQGRYACSQSAFDADNPCVDPALAHATLTPLQQSMLTDLCTACNTPVATCLDHSEINGPHRFGAGVVYASDDILRSYGESCIAQGKPESFNLNCENAAYNCLTDAIFGSPLPCP
jgi:hypothetical protein